MSLEADETGGRTSGRKRPPVLPSSSQLNSRSFVRRVRNPVKGSRMISRAAAIVLLWFAVVLAPPAELTAGDLNTDDVFLDFGVTLWCCVARPRTSSLQRSWQ